MIIKEEELFKNLPKWQRPVFDEERKKQEVTYFIFPTHKCNLRCTYCYYNELGYTLPKMTTKVMEGIIDFLNNWETAPKISIHYFGGEPLTAWDVVTKFTLMAKSKLKKPVRFSMTTNGTLLDKEKLDFIKKYFRPEHPFLLSLDGPAKIHNKHRKTAAGKGSFDQIPLDLISKYYNFKNLEVRPTYTKDMLPNDVIESIKWLYKKGFRSIPVEWDYEIEWSKKDIEKLQITIEGINNIWLESVKLNDPMSKPKTIAEVENLFFMKNNIKQNYLCGRGFNSMGIDSQGNVWPCQRWAGYTEKNAPDFKLGDVFNGVDLNKLYLVQQIQRHKMKEPEGMNCKTCEIRGSCSGGCNAGLWIKHGSRFQLDPEYCKIRKQMFKTTMKWMFSKNYYHDFVLPGIVNMMNKNKNLQNIKPKFDIRPLNQRKQNINNNSCKTGDCKNCFSCQNKYGGK